MRLPKPRITQHSDFEETKVNERITLPNGLSLLRGLGGAALGLAMMSNKGADIDWKLSLGLAAGFALTDAEGTLINWAASWKSKVGTNIREKAKIFASTFGERYDVYADKAFMLFSLLGGVAGGYISPAALSVLAPEATTAAFSADVSLRTGKDPEVKKVGKWGMIARFSEIGAYITAYSLKDSAPQTSEVLTHTGYGLTATAVILGFWSCYEVYKQGRDKPEVVSDAVQIIQQKNGFRPMPVAV